MVADISEDFESPYKKFLATTLQYEVYTFSDDKCSSTTVFILLHMVQQSTS